MDERHRKQIDEWGEDIASALKWAFIVVVGCAIIFIAWRLASGHGAILW